MDRESEPTIWCGNLAQDVTEELLYELFIQAGPVERVTIPKDKEGRRRNFGFVTFKHAISIPYALELFSGIYLFDEQVRLKNRGGNNIDNQHLLPNYNQAPTSPGNFGNFRNGYNARGSRNEQYPNRRPELPISNNRGRNYDNPRNQNDRYDNRDIRRDEGRDMHGRQSGRRYGVEHPQHDTMSSPWMDRGGRNVLGNNTPWQSPLPGSNFSSSCTIDRNSIFDPDIERKINQRRKMVLPKPINQAFKDSTGIIQMKAWYQ